jgi:hypothetical protein
MCHMEKLQLEISWGVILQMHTSIVVIYFFCTFNILEKKYKWSIYIYIYIQYIGTHPKILKSVK